MMVSIRFLRLIAFYMTESYDFCGGFVYLISTGGYFDGVEASIFIWCWVL